MTARFLALVTKRPYAALALLCLLLWAPGTFSLPALDRDESRFAQSSKQMLETGDLIDIRFGLVPRYKKPVGIYWLQAATTEIAGLGNHGRIWTYRLPSLIGAIIAVWLVFWTASAFAGGEVALLAAALMGSTLLLTAEASIATTDAVLLACIMAVQGVLMRAYLAARDPERAPPSLKLALIGWAALAFGLLVKGPAVLVAPGATLVALILWDRQWRWLGTLRPFWGVLLLLLITLPWLIAIWIKSDGAFYSQSLGDDFAAKLAGGQESHTGLPGYYLLLSTVTFWPAILFLLPALASAVRRRGEPVIRFLLAWAGASWLLFELVPTYLPHYVLPAYPALALLGAIWALGPRDENAPGWQRVLIYVAAIQFAIGVAGFAAAPVLLPKFYGMGSTWWLYALAALGVCLGLAALIVFLRHKPVQAFAWALLAALVFYPTLTVGTAPRLTELWVSQHLADIVAAKTLPGDPPVALAGYEEPSLVFLLGMDTRIATAEGAAEASATQGGLALIEDSEQPAFFAHLAEREADATTVAELSGFNYSRGRKVHINVYRVGAVRELSSPPPE